MRLKTKKGCFNAAALSEMQQSDFVDQHKDNPYFGDTEPERVKFLTGIHKQACHMANKPAYKDSAGAESTENTAEIGTTEPKKAGTQKKRTVKPEEKKE